jgi:hypothetical protein
MLQRTHVALTLQHDQVIRIHEKYHAERKAFAHISVQVSNDKSCSGHSGGHEGLEIGVKAGCGPPTELDLVFLSKPPYARWLSLLRERPEREHEA